VLAGAGDRAFCTGGDQSAHDGKYDGRGTIGLPMEELHAAIRDVPKPVIARVQGYAIGGGNVLCHHLRPHHRSEKAVFGQVGPKMGSVDPGYGTAFLARVVGEKKAREIWYLCRRYSAAEARAMGLVNAACPTTSSTPKCKWCEEIMERSPTALAIAKRSFNMDTAHQAGIAGMGLYALKLYYDTEESREGVRRFKRSASPTSANRKYASAKRNDAPNPYIDEDLVDAIWPSIARRFATDASRPVSRSATGRACSTARDARDGRARLHRARSCRRSSAASAWAAWRRASSTRKSRAPTSRCPTSTCWPR
jgi:2-ketocyclohexanecarboxyl-CoA hydrolase